MEKKLNTAKKHYNQINSNDREILSKLKGVNSQLRKFEKIIEREKEYLF